MVPTLSYPPTTWVRSKTGMIAGVCDGIARRMGVETWMVRFFWLITVLFFGTGVLAYIVLAICLPREDKIAEANEKIILGVATRIARRSNIEVGLVRAGIVLITCFTGGAAIVAYIALFFLMPEPGQSNPNVL